MTRLGTGTGNGARRPAPPILPRDVRERPRYAENFLPAGSFSSPSRPGEADGSCADTLRETDADHLPPDGFNLATVLRQLIERAGELPDGGGPAAFQLAGRLAALGPNPTEKEQALAFGLARKPGQRRLETIVKKLSRDDGIRELAARHPDLKGRALWRLVSREFGVSPGTARRALEQR